MKRLIVFDLDGTLAESKSSLDAEMSSLIYALLGIVRVAVISGGAWPQFEAQVLAELPRDERLMRLSLLPTCGIRQAQEDQLRDVLGIALKEMLFIGDALFVGGNDHPAREAGVQSIQVRDPGETKRVIETLLACLESSEGATGA